MTGDVSTDTILRWRGVASFGWLVILLVWESLSPCFAWFHSSAERVRHALRNWALTLLNVIAVALVFVGLWRAIAGWTAEQGWGLLNLFRVPGAVRLVLAIVLLDLWTYAWHRANHRLPFLWRFHRVHHSDASMDVTTANRFHLGEIVLSSVLRLAVIPAFGIRFGDLVVYETLLQIVVQWHHANIALPPRLERWLRWGVVTPGLHKVHHSREPIETDSNYASLFPIWDRVFRSLRVRQDLHALRLGLDRLDAPQHQSWRALLRNPFERW